MPFTGHAVYDSGVLSGMRESVSQIISDISPRETPLLDRIGDADMPSAHVKYEWLEDSLAPNRLTMAAAVASTTASTAIAVSNGLGRYLQPGTILSASGARIGSGQITPEYFRITSIQGPDTIVCDRAFAGTIATSYASGEFAIVISNAQLDGRDVANDSSRPRTRVENYTEIFSEDVILSGTSLVMDYHGGINEQDHQVAKKLRENLLKLERTVLLGRTTGNTIGSASAVRTMRGILHFIGQNSDNVKSFDTSATSPATTFEQNLLDAIEVAWQNGGTDLNLIVAGAKLKRQLDQLNASRIRTVREDKRFGNNIYEFECAYGTMEIQLNRWLHGNMALFLASDRIKVVPLKGRSFDWIPTAKTGDSEKGMVLGEYTLELRNPLGMSAALFPNLGQIYTP